MNTQNLHEIIDRYTANYESINDSDHNEIFKWKAVKHFHDVWHSKSAEELSFSQLFNEAKKKCSVLIDNGYVCPASGIVKIAEQCQEEVKNLFHTVLFADDNGCISTRQNNMDRFISEMDKLRQTTFPTSFKYKQDRHAVSCYLSLVSPEENFIYRYSEAEEFAKYIEFGLELGSGENFKLENYYKMCELLVDALKDHQPLLDKYYSLLDASCYHDESLHLLAFDVIYCARAYNFYNGLEHKSKKETLKAYKLSELREKERLEREQKIADIENVIRTLEIELEQYKQISLLDVEVTQKTYGTGRIIGQSGSTITVAFSDCEKKFIINRKYSMRPTFEDDSQIVDAFTRFDAILLEIKKHRKELKNSKVLLTKTRTHSFSAA